MTFAILTHGGAASSRAHADGCAAAAAAARATLQAGGDAFAAALAATALLEDDPRFNAGTGSNLRLDGQTIEMDASVMTSDGRFGAVACIQHVKNPVLVAARVTETPHLMLVGEGATAFARRLGFVHHDPTTERARAKYARALAELRGKGDGDFALDAEPWRSAPPAQFWNFTSEPLDCDTVGAVVRDEQGRFAATASTGGTVYMLRGRVGDSPLMGCGVYAGPAGAVATTGVGEEIVRRFLAKAVYDQIAQSAEPARAAEWGVRQFPEAIDVGILVASREGHAIAANRDMASAALAG